jgi:hypothetical protein
MQEMAQESISCYSPVILLFYSPDLAPLDFHFFGPLKQHLGGRRWHGNEEVEMAVREWLRMQHPDLYHDGIFKLAPRWEKCTNLLGDCVKK